MLRVLLADDHEVFLHALAQLVDADPRLEVVGRAGDGEEAVALAEELRPDVVMLDAVMPGTDGLEAARRIRRQLPDTGVVLVSGLEQDDWERRAAEVGASVWMTKEDAIARLPDELARAGRSEV
jgi:two-component system, NarL family, response regulator LiaR